MKGLEPSTFCMARTMRERPRLKLVCDLLNLARKYHRVRADRQSPWRQRQGPCPTRGRATPESRPLGHDHRLSDPLRFPAGRGQDPASRSSSTLRATAGVSLSREPCATAQVSPRSRVILGRGSGSGGGRPGGVGTPPPALRSFRGHRARRNPRALRLPTITCGDGGRRTRSTAANHQASPAGGG